jgi:hypothetical protein
MCDACAALPPIVPWEDPAASAQTDAERNGHSSGLRFLTPMELLAQTPANVEWVWRDYLARGAVTLLAGKPKSGKSTLALGLVRAITRGAEFLGRPTTRTGVVYVSEEAGSTLLHKVPGDVADLHLLTRDNAWPRPPWRDVIAAAAAQAHALAAGLIVVDTFAYWAALAADQEKDAGAAQTAIEPLLEAANSGLAVLLPGHTRKAPGEGGDAVRGSSAIAGTVDVVLELERPAGSQQPRQRVLAGLGRYPQTPGALLVEHDLATDSWRVVGEGADRQDARAIGDRQALLDTLPSSEPGVTRADLEEQLDAPHRQFAAQLDKLIEEGLVTRDGEGKKGDPYRWRRIVRNPPAQNPRTIAPGAAAFSSAPPVRAAEENDAASPLSARCAETVDVDEELSWLDDLATRHEEAR